MVYAEEVNYWKTSRTSPDRWVEKAKREITRAGGDEVARTRHFMDDELLGAREIYWVVKGEITNEMEAEEERAAKRG